MTRSLLTAILLAAAAPGIAQVPAGNSAPQAAAFADTIPLARDTPYPGTILLDIDASDTRRGIFRVKETIPVARSGHMVLLYPEWLPGNHRPSGQIEKLAGLVIRANGTILPWTRDKVDVFAFHIDVPEGASALDVHFEFVSATKSDQGRVAMTPTLISLQPNSVSLYPAGYYVRQIPVQMTVRYPEGFTAAGALRATPSGRPTPMRRRITRYWSTHPSLRAATGRRGRSARRSTSTSSQTRPRCSPRRRARSKPTVGSSPKR
jgi:hypothetical protein